MKEIFEKSLSNFSLDEFAKNLVDFSILKAFANFSQDTDITNEEPQLVNNNQSEYFDESLTCERNTHLINKPILNQSKMTHRNRNRFNEPSPIDIKQINLNTPLPSVFKNTDKAASMQNQLGNYTSGTDENVLLPNFNSKKRQSLNFDAPQLVRPDEPRKHSMEYKKETDPVLLEDYHNYKKSLRNMVSQIKDLSNQSLDSVNKSESDSELDKCVSKIESQRIDEVRVEAIENESEIVIEDELVTEASGEMSEESEGLAEINSGIESSEDEEKNSHIIVINTRNRTKHDLAITYGFNEDDIGLFEETFQIFDKDCDGSITFQEIKTVMNALGFYPCDENIKKGINDIDNDGDGSVDFEEFICMMSKSRSSLDQELKEIFQIFDKNQDGFIDQVELKDVLIRLGEHISDDEVFEMIREADVDSDNRVSLAEFRTVLGYDCRNRFS